MEIYVFVAYACCACVCVDGWIWRGNQAQANYPIPGFCVCSNYTSVVRCHCCSLAAVVIAHQSGLVFSPCSFLKKDPGSGGYAGTRRGTGEAVGAASLTSVCKCGNHSAGSSA